MTTTPTERRLAITPGACETVRRNNDVMLVAGTSVVAEVGRADLEGWDQVIANARLYADAHNTYQACDLTPSELLARLREAEAKVEKLNERWDSYQDHLSRPEP